jgi:hypothetical protein
MVLVNEGAPHAITYAIFTNVYGTKQKSFHDKQ